MARIKRASSPSRVRLPQFLRFFLYFRAFLYFSRVCSWGYIRFRIKISPGLFRCFCCGVRIGFLLSFSNIFFVESELCFPYGRKGGNFDKGCCYNVPRGTLRCGMVSCDIRPYVFVKKIVSSASFITLHNVVITADCSPLKGGRHAARNETDTTNTKDKLYEKPKPQHHR